jgi:hypothetical protein
MSFASFVLMITAGSACVAWIGFGLSYSRVRWERSPEGRNVMVLTICLVVLMGTIAFNQFIPWMEVKLLLVTLSLLGIAITGVWRTYQLKAAQKAHKARTETSKRQENE